MSVGEQEAVGDDVPQSAASNRSMIVACLFSHTEYSLWGLHLVERVLRVIWGGYNHIHCQDLAGLRDAWARRGEQPVLIASDAPKEELIRLFSATRISCVVFLDDPMRLIEQSIYLHGVPPMDALRGCTHFFTAFGQANSINNALIFRREETEQSAETVARRVVAAVSDDTASDNVEAIVAAVLADTPALPMPHAETDLLSVALQPEANPRVFPSPKDLAIIKSVVDDYRPLYRPDGMSFVNWPRELFFTANPGEGRPQEIALAGDARVLIRGPYCSLPAGRWRLAVEFEVTDHVSGDSVEADVVFGFGAGVLARGLFVLPDRGIFRYALDFSIDEAKPAIETRLRTLKATIRGILCLRAVTATKTGARGELHAQIREAGAPDGGAMGHAGDAAREARGIALVR